MAVPYTFVAGTAASASEVNANFTDVDNKALARVVTAGASGGQTVEGGTAASENLILASTHHATKGSVIVRTASIVHKLLAQTAATVTLDETHNIIDCDTTSNGITITLPDASTYIGKEYTIYLRLRPGSNNVTINRAGSDTIDGATSYVLGEQGAFITIRSIQADRWAIVAKTGEVDRGDPAATDFDEGDLTTDATWRDLDLSSIVPTSVRFVHLLVEVTDDAAGSLIKFRKNGNSNAIGCPQVVTQVAAQINVADIWVPCDTSRVIEYYATNVTFSAIDITVLGWKY